MFRVSISPAVLAVVLVSAISCFAGNTWLQLKTDNFDLIGDIERSELQTVAQTLESFHKNLKNKLGPIPIRSPYITKVIAVRDASRFRLSGGVQSRDDLDYIVIDLKENKDESYGRIFHEYTRFLINNNIGQGKIPPWFNEGLAEYFARRSIKSELIRSEQNNLFSLRLLLETDYYTLQNQTAERKAIFDVQAWGLVSFLITKKSGGKFDLVRKLIEELQRGREMPEAFISIFQTDLNNLESEFARFLNQMKLVSDDPPLMATSADFIEIRSIPESQGLAVLGDCLYGYKRAGDGTQLLERSLQLQPDNSLALTTLALIKAEEYYYDEAIVLNKKALENEPLNFFNHYRYALTLSKIGMTEYGFVSGYSRTQAEEMRRSLKKAIELNPGYIESGVLLAFVNFVRNEYLDEAHSLVKSALAVAPGNQRYLLRLSEIELRKENFTEARRIALGIFRSSANEQLRLYTENTLQRIDSTEFQLERLRNEKAKYGNDGIVTEKPLTDEEIIRLREKATNEQISAVLRRPKSEESRILVSLIRIDCGKENVVFVFRNESGLIKLQSKTLANVSLVSYIEEMSDFRLGCGLVSTKNTASIIYKTGIGVTKLGELVSIEFVPLGFRLQN